MKSISAIARGSALRFAQDASRGAGFRPQAAPLRGASRGVAERETKILPQTGLELQPQAESLAVPYGQGIFSAVE
jgi:hypothetical protein